MSIELTPALPARAHRAFAGHWRDETARLADAAVHMIGGAAGLLAAPALISAVGAGPDGSGGPLLAYALALAILFPASALFQHGPAAWRHVTIKIDHAAIHLKIAASGAALAAVAGVEAGPALWLVALAGAALRAAGPARMRGASLAIHLAILIAALAAIVPAFAELGSASRTTALMGAAIYLAGVLVHLIERTRFHQAIWHATVLFGAASVCVAVLLATS